MLTAHALSVQALQKSIQMGARAYIPKEKMAEIVPFLEDVLALSYRPGGNGSLKSWEASSAPPSGRSGRRAKKPSGKR